MINNTLLLMPDIIRQNSPKKHVMDSKDTDRILWTPHMQFQKY